MTWCAALAANDDSGSNDMFWLLMQRCCAHFHMHLTHLTLLFVQVVTACGGQTSLPVFIALCTDFSKPGLQVFSSKLSLECQTWMLDGQMHVVVLPGLGFLGEQYCVLDTLTAYPTCPPICN